MGDVFVRYTQIGFLFFSFLFIFMWRGGFIMGGIGGGGYGWWEFLCF